MKFSGHCPGCGGGAGNQVCKIAKCSLEHGNIEYCYLCAKFPCQSYVNIDKFDSFISHQNQLKDIAKVKSIGLKEYLIDQKEKIEILKFLIANYNDGRRKTFFFLAINLLDLNDIKPVIQQIITQTQNMELKEKSQAIVNLLQNIADKHNIILKLNKKTNRYKI